MKKIVSFLVICIVAGVAVAEHPPLPMRELSKHQHRLNKCDSGLRKIQTADDPLAAAEASGFRTEEGAIQVMIQAKPGSATELEHWLAPLDAHHISSAMDFVQAFVPLTVLLDLNDHPDVISVRRPLYLDSGPAPESTQSLKILGQTTEGLQAMNAQAWHGAGYTGQGLKIGIIDGGYTGVDSLMGAELPDSSRVWGMSFGGTDFYGSKHGTGCAEIVYDIAPGVAEMHLAAVSTVIDMVNAGAWLDSQGVDIITMSMGFGLGFSLAPGDGTGPLADLVDYFAQEGGLVVISAGNSGDNHWQGNWTDNNSNSWLNFSPSEELNYLVETDGTTPIWVSALSTIDVTLVWNQWNRPTTDLDLCLYRWTNQYDLEIVSCSEDEQSGLDGQLPVENVSYLTLLGGYFGVGVFHYAGNPSVDMELEYAQGRPRYLVPAGSILVPADSPSALAVGALDAVSPYPIEDYSSRGPTNGPGGSLTGGITKPDIAGYANVSTAIYGPRTPGQYSFNGTSAACPHATGAAAVVWSANPGWTGNQVKNYLQSNAIDMGPGGKDNTYGYGRLHLGNPPVSCTYSISPTSASFSASGGSGSFSVNTQSGCTWNATPNRTWIHITSGSSGNGTGTVSFSVDSHSSSSSRSGSITAAGKNFTITQSGAASCSYSISPTTKSFGASGGSGTVNVSTSAGCAWSAASNSGWISITSGTNGNGSGSVAYSVAANSGASRSGTMTIAGKTFTVSQSAGGGGGGSVTYQVAGIAHASGAGGSSWRSTLCITNRSGSTANLTLKYRTSGGAITRTHTLQNNRIKEWEDVAVTLFNQSGSTSGAIEVTANTPVLVIARTYNQGADGTFGQALPGNDESATLTSGDTGILPLLKKTSAFRTNVGFMNHQGASCNVRIRLYSEQGAQLGTHIDVSVPAYGWKQVNDVFSSAGVGHCQIGYATIEVRTSGGKVWAYGSVVDNGTGDPTTVPVYVQ